MNIRMEHNNRRSNSQLLPRVFMFLQLSALALVGYLLFTILKAIGVPSLAITLLFIVIGAYYTTTFFMKCRYITKRNNVSKTFQQ